MGQLIAESRSGRAGLDAVVRLMSDFPALWCIAGGWAIDLFLGRTTRDHDDVDVAIFRDDQLVIHGYFPDWSKRKVVAGVYEDWLPTEWLSLPEHEIHIESPDDPPEVIEFLLNERDGDEWLFRRDLTVTLPVDKLIQADAGGLPILSPAVVLLYKAKAPRQKDEADFRMTVPRLALSDREWLRQALERVHPGHHWLTKL